jgi:predicted small lipoprotein YifL
VIRTACLLPVVLLLAACGGEGPAPLPSDQIKASFLRGGIADQIEVSTIDRLPLRGAELVAPDGHATPALSITANPAPTESFSQQFPNSPYSGANFGVSSIQSNALSPGIVGAAPQTQTKLLAVISIASIPLPDPVAYHRDWPKYRIRLRFGDPPQTERREIAAPAPLAPAG